MLIFDHCLLEDLSLESARSPRRRVHSNIHSSLDEQCQSVLNAIQPDSYTPPHRHELSNPRELLMAVRGRLAPLEFDDEGGVVSCVQFGTELHHDDECQSVGVELLPSSWHTVLAMEEDSILLEVKQGPFVPHEGKELAAWGQKSRLKGAELLLAERQARARRDEL